MFADCLFERAGRSHDLVAAVDVSGFAQGHETDPAGGDEGAGPRAGHGRRGIDAAGPGGEDEVLVAAQGAVAIEDDGATLGGEAVFVRVSADASDAWKAEVEAALFLVRGGIAGAFKEGDDEGTQAAVDVERDFVLEG